MPKCDKGHEADVTKAAIIDGKFGNYCPQHIQETGRMATAQHAAWHRQRDFEDHRRDLIQPFDAHGNVNPEFVREYPEEAAETFSPEQINEANRNV